MGGKGVLPQTLADPAGSNRIGVVCQLWTGTPRRCVRTGTCRHAHPSLEHDPHDARTARVVPERLVWAGSARWEGVEMRAWPGVLRSSPRPGSGTSAVALPPLWRVEANACDQGGGPMTTQTWKTRLARLTLMSACVLALTGCTERVALGPEVIQGQTPDG